METISNPSVDNYSSALVEWRNLIGEEFVDGSPSTRERLARGTFSVTGRVLALLRPGNPDEVANCLCIASSHGVPVNIFSRGRNYGYSSNGPGTGATVAIELSRLSEITEFDEELGYIRVQAGVTFSQLERFLVERGSHRFFAATGGPSDGSILANTMERGHGLGFGGDRYNYSCRYEVVTARGERFETGFGRFEGSKIANLMRVGVGPSLDGIFTQSSFGVVTAATIWLSRRPRYWMTFLVTTPSSDRIGLLYTAVGEAVRQGLVRDGSAFAISAYKLASLQFRREDFQLSGTDAVSWDVLATHAYNWGNAAWLFAVTIEADTRPVLKAKQQAVAYTFRSLLVKGERLVAITAIRKKLARIIVPVLPRYISRIIGQIVDVFYTKSPVLGNSIADPLRTVYWPIPRASNISGADRDLVSDGIGLIWISVPVPLRESDINNVCKIIDDGLVSHGFEPFTQVTLCTERLVRVITAINYDRSTPSMDERAMRCQYEVYETLRHEGYYTYRLQPHMMQEYATYGTAHQVVVSRLKQALDPCGVLDPNRYPGMPL